MWIISLPYADADDSINIRYKLFIRSKGIYIYIYLFIYLFIYLYIPFEHMNKEFKLHGDLNVR